MSLEARQQRLQEIEELRRLGIEPYPYRFERTHNTEEIRKAFDQRLEAGQTLESERVSTAGRVMALRKHGKSIFFVLQDFHGTIQGYIRKKEAGDEVFKRFDDFVNIGDHIGIRGFPFKSKTGELTVFVLEYEILSKSLRTLPEKWHGLKDKEIIYRQRYLDLIANRESLNRFVIRSRAISFIRDFLNSRGFLEVETPILHHVTGGANARPFVTHLNALDIDMYLRIAPELHLKRLIVGGFEKVYELGKNFRNEGISYKHNPEFTSIEVYQAYADYSDMMELTEEMITELVRFINGGLKINYQGVEIDFTRPWKRVSMRDYIKEHLDVDILEDPDERLLEVVESHGQEVSMKERGHLIEKLWDLVEDGIVHPTFVTDYPVEISPLAKRHRLDPRLTERFELIIFGREIANAFSELNDPVDQLERFRRQAQLRAAGDEEAQMMDEDFVRALEYGMPPTGGLGIGIDRLVMFLTDVPSIRDVILFPLVRPQGREEREDEEA
ncbi:MAG: lysyl-tRNA synthetase, class [Thermotogota bacterium]|nr:lysyl-tRNA synthetase, class [Thermotogota bacterium]MDK2864020.1 lysyl-tRNA synthetase, class [Thermotogota bacterium]HCZ06228.1 lysine--tRNA ligase [Thermotogota bacterium]